MDKNNNIETIEEIQNKIINRNSAKIHLLSQIEKHSEHLISFFGFEMKEKVINLIQNNQPIFIIQNKRVLFSNLVGYLNLFVIPNYNVYFGIKNRTLELKFRK